MLSIMDHQHVISKNISQSVDGHVHHLQLVSESTKGLHHSFIMTNYVSNMGISIVDWRFENHWTRDVFMKTQYPDLDLQVSFLPA